MNDWMRSLLRDKWLPWVLLILTFTGCIALLTYAIKNGGVSHDGSYYLRLAKSLSTELKVFQTGFDEKGDGTSQYFPAMRPIGYPLAIALVSWLSQLPVAISAKLLAVGCGGFVFSLFYGLYGLPGLALSTLLLTSLCLELYFSVLSGSLFTTLLVAWVYLLNKSFTASFSWYSIAGTALVGASIFATRYVGVVILPVLAVLVVYNPALQKIRFNTKQASLLMTTCLIVGGYLIMNYQLAGYFLPDHPFQNSSLLWLVGDFFFELVNSLNLLFSILYRGWDLRLLALGSALILQVSIFLFWTKRMKPSLNRIGKPEPLTQITWLTATLYLVMLLVIYVIKFYTLSYRFMVPAIVLIGWGIFNQLYATQTSNFLKTVCYSMLTLAVISVGFNGLFRSAYHLVWKPTPTYPEHIANITGKYDHIPGSSVVVFPEKDLNYLRLDLVSNYSAVRHKPSEWLNSIAEGSNANFYLNTCNPEFSAFMQKTFPAKRKEWRNLTDTASSCVTPLP